MPLFCYYKNMLVKVTTQATQKFSENDLRRITKIAYVKILLKQCRQKGFNVNS